MSDDVPRITREHLAAIAAAPRPTGSESAARAREYCARVLAPLGFRVAEQPFEYSAFPGRYGTPIGGIIGVATIWAAALLSSGGHASVAAGVLILAAGLLAGGGVWLARRGILSLGALRSRGVNLEAMRGEHAPVVWLVAHIDSKSQPVPLVARAAGIVVLASAWIAALAVALVDASTAAHATNAVWWWIASLATIGAMPVIATVVGTRSPGAVDNASGVATVLAAAALLPASVPLGVLVTDAEELGLAGARAWCNQPRTAIVLNCDGVDDRGELTAMYTRRRSARLTRALRDAARAGGESLHLRRLLPGVLVDGVAFADAGCQAMTLSRGTLWTLRRIHTARDDLRTLRGDGIAATARIMASAALALTEER